MHTNPFNTIQTQYQLLIQNNIQDDLGITYLKFLQKIFEEDHSSRCCNAKASNFLLLLSALGRKSSLRYAQKEKEIKKRDREFATFFIKKKQKPAEDSLVCGGLLVSPGRGLEEIFGEFLFVYSFHSLCIKFFPCILSFFIHTHKLSRRQLDID